MKQVLLQFIPIFLLFLIVSYTEKMVEWSNTSLGKLVVIMIILFYASIDKLYGVLVCLLFILFYQSDTVENMLNKQEYKFEGFEPVEDRPTKHEAIKPIESVSYTAQYEMPKISSEVAKKEFRKKYCEKGHLVNKGQKIKNDMAEHVHPEIEFPNEKCNICDSTCEYSIVEKQIDISERIKPKSCR